MEVSGEKYKDVNISLGQILKIVMFFSRWFDPRLSCLALLPRLESTVAFIPPLLKTEPVMANMGSNFATNKSEKEKKRKY